MKHVMLNAEGDKTLALGSRSETIKLRHQMVSLLGTQSAADQNACMHVSEVYRDADISLPSEDAKLVTLFASSHYRKSDNSFSENINNLAVPKTLRSSCSTIFVDSTLSHPNSRLVLQEVSLAFSNLIQPDGKNEGYCLVDEIYKFLKEIFCSADLSAECAIVALIYLERALGYGEIRFTDQNWKKLILGAVILSSKVWDDQAVWNVDYCNIANGLSIQEMNHLERDYLNFLRFNTNVSSAVYAKYYFDLRNLAASSRKCSKMPLTIEKARQLGLTADGESSIFASSKLTEKSSSDNILSPNSSRNLFVIS